VIFLFKQKSPANIILLLIFGLLIKLPIFLYPKEVVATENDGRLYHALLEGINPAGNGALLASVIAFILLYVQALMINYLVNEYRMTTRQTYLPAMAYLMITSLLPEWSVLSAALVSNLFIILIFTTLFRLYNQTGVNSKIFNVGLLAGLTSFIFFSSLLFALAIILGLMILRAFRLNEFFLLLMGAATPYYFYAAYLFLTDRFVAADFFPEVYLQVPQLQRSLWLVGSTLLLAIPFLIGGYFIQAQLRKMLIQARKNWSILLLFLLLAFGVPFVNSTSSFHTWILTAAPFAAFHACAYLYPVRKWLPLFIFFATLMFIISQQFLTTAWQ
jgi:hypothetical protein